MLPAFYNCKKERHFIIRLTLVILLLFCMAQISGQSFEPMTHPLSAKTENVRKIREKTRNWTTYYYYDTTGLLIREVSYNKRQKRAEDQFEYIMTDTMLIVKEIYENSYSIKRFHYGTARQVSKYELFFDTDTVHPSGLAYNFVYEDNLLISFDWSIVRPDTIFPPLKTTFIYNDKRQMIIKQESCLNDIFYRPPRVVTTFHMYRYDSNGRLTDQVVENTDKKSAFTGVPVWSKEQSNKYHLILSDYDRHGQWRTSYYLTENKKILWSKRKIKYWK